MEQYTSEQEVSLSQVSTEAVLVDLLVAVCTAQLTKGLLGNWYRVLIQQNLQVATTGLT